MAIKLFTKGKAREAVADAYKEGARAAYEDCAVFAETMADTLPDAVKELPEFDSVKDILGIVGRGCRIKAGNIDAALEKWKAGKNEN